MSLSDKVSEITPPVLSTVSKGGVIIYHHSSSRCFFMPQSEQKCRPPSDL